MGEFKKIFAAAVAACVALSAGAWGMSETVTGTVKCGKKPLAGVTVSDGYNCVVTGADGRYTLTKNDRANYITVSTPAGYLPPVDENLRPLFYLPVEEGKTDYSFELIKNKKDDRRHVFMTQADVQVVSEEELGIYDVQVADAREHFRQFKDADVFAIDCGDVVGDHPELYESSMRHRAGFGAPMYIANGNHDMLYYVRSHELSKDRFEHKVGPTNYSFNRGNIHYVVIDNCFYIGRDYFYMGYVDEQTFDWLEQDLARVPAGSTVVMVMHIPVANQAEKVPFRYDGVRVSQETVNAAHLIEMMKPYNTHFITGHQHWSRNIEFSDSCFEHNTPGACGMWWDVDLCEDGTPRGYGVYMVDGDNIEWYFKSTGRDKDYQFRAYAPGKAPEFPSDIVANVWNHDSKWRVEWTEDGRVMGEMTQVEAVDPLTAEKVSDRSKLRYSWIGASKTPHMFHATPVNPDARLGVKVTDRFGNVYTQDL